MGNPQVWHAAHDETKKQGRKADELCKERGIELEKMATLKEQLEISLAGFYNDLSEAEYAALTFILSKLETLLNRLKKKK